MDETFNASLKKVLIPDNRLIQKNPTYGMFLGPQNIKVNYTPTNASSSSSLQWTVLPPSYNTRTDRFASIQGYIYYYFDVTLTNTGGAAGNGADLFTFGSDGGISAFPLHLECLNNNKVVMNDETFTMNSQDVNLSLVRTMNTQKLYYQRTTASSLDRFVNYSSANATGNGMNVLGGYFDGSADRINNGAYPVIFTDYAGNPLVADAVIPAGNGNPTAYDYVFANNRINLAANLPAAAGGVATTTTFRIFCRITVDEPAICPPFVFDEIYMKESSLFEIKSYTIDYNMNATFRLVKQLTTATNIANTTMNIIGQGLNPNIVPFGEFEFVNYWLQLPASIQSPAQCVVDYLEFPRSIKIGSAVAAQPANTQLSVLQQQEITSNVIEPMGVPDMLIISVAPQTYANAGAGNYYFESNWMCAIQNISITWGEKSNLCSDMSSYELYKISCKNGLNMTWLEWSGQAVNVVGAGGNNFTPTVGGPVYLRPGIDIGLDGLVSGQNIRQQFQVIVKFVNQSLWNITPELTVIYPVSTFAIFENGQCNKLTYPIKSADIFNTEAVIPEMSLTRKIGAGVLHRMNNNVAKHHGHKFFREHHKVGNTGAGSHSGGVKKSHHRKRSKSASRRAYRV